MNIRKRQNIKYHFVFINISKLLFSFLFNKTIWGNKTRARDAYFGYDFGFTPKERP